MFKFICGLITGLVICNWIAVYEVVVKIIQEVVL